MWHRLVSSRALTEITAFTVHVTCTNVHVHVWYMSIYKCTQDLYLDNAYIEMFLSYTVKYFVLNKSRTLYFDKLKTLELWVLCMYKTTFGFTTIFSPIDIYISYNTVLQEN